MINLKFFLIKIPPFTIYATVCKIRYNDTSFVVKRLHCYGYINRYFIISPFYYFVQTLSFDWLLNSEQSKARLSQKLKVCTAMASFLYTLRPHSSCSDFNAKGCAKRLFFNLLTQPRLTCYQIFIQLI